LWRGVKRRGGGRVRFEKLINSTHPWSIFVGSIRATSEQTCLFPHHGLTERERRGEERRGEERRGEEQVLGEGRRKCHQPNTNKEMDVDEEGDAAVRGDGMDVDQDNGEEKKKRGRVKRRNDETSDAQGGGGIGGFTLPGSKAPVDAGKQQNALGIPGTRAPNLAEIDKKRTEDRFRSDIENAATEEERIVMNEEFVEFVDSQSLGTDNSVPENYKRHRNRTKYDDMKFTDRYISMLFGERAPLCPLSKLSVLNEDDPRFAVMDVMRVNLGNKDMSFARFVAFDLSKDHAESMAEKRNNSPDNVKGVVSMAFEQGRGIRCPPIPTGWPCKNVMPRDLHGNIVYNMNERPADDKGPRPGLESLMVSDWCYRDNMYPWSRQLKDSMRSTMNMDHDKATALKKGDINKDQYDHSRHHVVLTYVMTPFQSTFMIIHGSAAGVDEGRNFINTKLSCRSEGVAFDLGLDGVRFFSVPSLPMNIIPHVEEDCKNIETRTVNQGIYKILKAALDHNPNITFTD
jgi:hypothetical protein